jgi:hypothetical protein
MKRADVFPSQYIGKDDVQTPIILHVGSVELRNVGTESEQEEKPVIAWQEPDAKPLIVNSTNWAMIESLYGEESDDWRGKPIELYFDPFVTFRGKRVGGVRVRRPSSEQVKNTPF